MSIQHQNMVFEAEGLKGPEKLLLLAYCNYTDGHGYCWAGIERIADDTGTSVRTVKRIRAELAERGLLGTKRRLNPRTGQALTNLTRVNLDALAAMKRAPRVYDDNAVEEITFTDDQAALAPVKAAGHTAPDQPTCQADPTPGPDRHHPGDNLAPPYGGANLAPNPSVDPSSSSSAPDPAEAEEEDDDDPASSPPLSSGHPPTRTPVAAVMDATGATAEEARRLVDDIRAQPSVRSLARYVHTLIDNGDMAEHLARLRHRHTPTRPGSASVCAEHGTALPCASCRADVLSGDTAAARALLHSAGPQARPDLADLLETRSPGAAP